MNNFKFQYFHNYRIEKIRQAGWMGIGATSKFRNQPGQKKSTVGCLISQAA